MALSETWLTSLVPSECVTLPNFNLVRNDRGVYADDGIRLVQGGGVGCYIHNSLKFKILEISKNVDINSPEYMILEIKSSSSPALLLAILYRRPNGMLFSEFILKLNLYTSAYKNIVITGDLNCNLLQSSFESSFLRNFITDHSFFLVPHGPTHHTLNSHTQIDVFITDSNKNIIDYYQSQAPFIAGHNLIVIRYNLDFFRPVARTITYRNFRKCDNNALSSSITSAFRANDLGSVETETTLEAQVDTFVSTFNSCIITALDTHAPLTTARVVKPMAPWLTNELKSKIRSRDSLYNRARRMRSHELMSQYRLLRKQIKTDIKDAKNAYLLSSLTDQTDQTKIWSTLKKVGLIDSSSKSSLQHFSPIELNTHYANITSLHPPCTYDQLHEIIQRPVPPGIPTFSFSPLNHHQVHQMLLSSLSKSRGISPDGIQLSYLRDVLSSIVPPLTYLYNLSLSTGVYPSLWKTSYIIPLNKIAVPASPSDTRPIANLSHLAKAFDAIITRQITSYLESNRLLNYQQSGFRCNHSTQTALLRILDDVRQGIDQGHVTILVLFDFSKAFDSLNHSLILSSLRSLGFDELSLRWTFSYLSGRSQTIRDPEGTHVPHLPCTSGVPQGSSPGPILFIIFINGLFARLKHCKNNCNIFADDTQFHLSTPLSRLNEAIAELNGDISELVSWARDFGLVLNPIKTQAIILGSSQYLSLLQRLDIPPIVVDGVIIPYSSTVKNLGIYISSDLSWNRQVSQISSNAHHALYRLKYRASSLPSPIKLLLVNALILPYFDYACLVFNDASDYLNTKLQRLQNVALRFVFNLRRDTCLSPFRRKAKWLTTRARRTYFLGSLTYQIINTGSPYYLHERFREVDHTVRRSARQVSNSYHLPVCRTNIYAHSFWIMAIKNWGSIPNHIRQSPSLQSFKTSLFNHLNGSILVPP